MCALSSVRLFGTPWAVACQVPLSMRFSRQEYWNRLPCPPPGDLPNPGTESTFLVPPALAGGFFTIEPPGKTRMQYYSAIKRNEIGPFVETRMGLETVIHRESMSEKHILYINPYMWNLEKKWDRSSFLYSRNRDKDLKNKSMDSKGEMGWGEFGELGD